MNIPTVIVFKNGQPVLRWTGIPAKTQVQQALDAAKYGPCSYSSG